VTVKAVDAARAAVFFALLVDLRAPAHDPPLSTRTHPPSHSHSHHHPQISSALKDVSRIMRADGLQAQLWEAQVFTRPALRRVADAKASAARAARRRFRWSMGWVARRRERGF
jgi:hypothetical protein